MLNFITYIYQPNTIIMKNVLFFFLFSVCISCKNTKNISTNKEAVVDSLEMKKQYRNTIPVSEHLHFKNRVISALEYLVREDGVKGNNNFYIQDIVVDSNQKYTSPWVYWKEKNRLILFEPYQDSILPAKELYLSRRNLDLKKDVVPTIDDIHGSTYLITEESKQQYLTSCKKGSHFLIKK